MATCELKSEPTESYRLFAAWRTARAKWEIDQFDPAHLADDLPEEMDATHCYEDHRTLTAFLLHPAQSLQDLARKLAYFHREDGHCFPEAGEIIAALAADARKLSFADVCDRRAGDDRKGGH